jgi:serine/threonine-protein kinase
MAFAPPSGTVLLEALGAGTVFQVALVRDGDEVLVCKRPTSRAVREPAARAALVREAKALSLARHPALPTVRRVGSDEHGPYLLETRVLGLSLRALVAAWRERGALPALLLGHVAAEATRALAEIHALAGEQGPLQLSHGDLGPDHVLLEPHGAVRFVDLGAARWAGMRADEASGDRGTLPYAAPEVTRGEQAPDAAGDVYALAATLLFVATGEPPCAARTEPAMVAEIGEHGIAPARVETATAFSAEQRGALAAALRFERDARVTSAAALRDAFAPR